MRRENDALINSTSDALWSVSIDYKLISANIAFLNGLFENGGYKIKPGDNVLHNEYFPEEYLQYWKELYSKGLAGERILTEVFTPQAKSSALLWFDLRIEPILTDDKISGIACSMRDVTERKNQEDKIKELNKELEKRVKERPAELESVNNDLREVNDLFVGREARIIELKEELADLKNKIHSV